MSASESAVSMAVDLGASNGRVIAGRIDGDHLELTELHRFDNAPVPHGSTLRWDLKGLFAEILIGLAVAQRTFGSRFRRVSVDAWGVDYGLVDDAGDLVDLAYSYRDSRVTGVPAEVFSIIPPHELYATTGVSTMPINTIFQLYWAARHDPALLARASRLLLVPDVMSYWLSGVMTNEYTIATTSQMVDARTGQWATGTIESLGLPTALLGDIIPPGTALGELSGPTARTLERNDVQVISGASHDTASSVVAVPLAGADWAFLSSGTWSIIGVESSAPSLDPRNESLGITNEGGFGGRFLTMKNLPGLWLLQECMRQFSSEGLSLSHDAVVAAAAASPPFLAAIDTTDARFVEPGDMPNRIRRYCVETGQAEPQTHGEIARMILEGLAMSCRRALDDLEQVTGRPIAGLHIVGGGSRNELLNQMTADAIGRPVATGPSETTAIGNVLVQMMTAGELSGVERARALVRSTYPSTILVPGNEDAWSGAYARLADMEIL